MKRYFIPIILLLLLFGCVGNKPQLSVSFLPASPAHPYEGDEVTLSINVVNSASVLAKEFTVEVLVNNVSLKTDVLTLQPNSNQTMSFSWYPYSAGEYDVTARVDKGNTVSDPSAGKESSMRVSIAPAERVSMFSALPDRSLVNIGVINVTGKGITALYNYLPTMQEISGAGYLTFLRPYIKNFREVQIGTVDYADQRHGIIVFIRGVAPVQQLSALLSSFVKLETNLDAVVENKTINGVDVSIISSDALPAPLCIWRERGWSKISLYADSYTLETCDSMFGTYNSSYADMPLSLGNELAKAPPFNTSLLGATLHFSNFSGSLTANMSEYGAAFEDDEGFYGFYATKQAYQPQNNTCVGRILNRSSMQVCETPPINSTWAAVQRKVGDYSIVCLSTPKSGVLTASVEEKAVDLCFSLNYSGEERMWMSILDLLHQKRCELPDGFSCLSYDFNNATLQVNLTQNTGKEVVLNAFGCSSQTNASMESFKLAQPLTMPSNSSVTLNVPCHDSSGGTVVAAYTYFDSKLYLNYTIEGSNESKVVSGNLTIRKI